MPSASGSVDPGELKAGATLQDLVCAALDPELREEGGLGPDAIMDTRVIRYARQLERGGKPEFYGVTFLKDRFDDLDASADVFTADIDGIELAGASIDELPDILSAFRDDREASFSFSLYVNLAFLEHYFDLAPAAVAGWRGSPAPESAT